LIVSNYKKVNGFNTVFGSRPIERASRVTVLRMNSGNGKKNF